MAGPGEGYELLLRTLAGYAQNPNFGAVQMVGLGCDVVQIPTLTGHPALRDPCRFGFMTSRAQTPQVAQSLLDRITWWEDYTARNEGEMDNIPSPGNKRGGLTTILEKSLGAVAKAGTAPLTAVYKYAEIIDRPCFVFMDSAGHDRCSVTGQVASGANLICFTTGRGSVSGYKPVPCLKLGSNNDLFARMGPDIDVNCGPIAEGASIQVMGQEIYDLILRVASGDEGKSEAQGFGGVEFVPWQIGAVM